jgi:putative FmdB family regulatory protein
MPIYDYRCDECGATYDIFHKVREVVEDVVCPSCNSPKHTRLIGAPSIQMNGMTTKSSGESPAPSCCAGGACGLN